MADVQRVRSATSEWPMMIGRRVRHRYLDIDTLAERFRIGTVVGYDKRFRFEEPMKYGHFYAPAYWVVLDDMPDMTVAFEGKDIRV